MAAELVKDLRIVAGMIHMGERIALGRDVQLMEAAASEIERLLRVEEDHKNVMKAALYNEPNGIDLAHRLSTYAISART